MRFSAFIRTNITLLAAEWESFVRTTQLLPVQHLDSEPLRNSAAEFLTAIAIDMESSRPSKQMNNQREPFRLQHAPRLVAYGRKHAAMRLSKEFTMDQLTAEFRALRSIVQRRWAAEPRAGEDVQELIRFNEAVDEALAECLNVYGFHVSHARELYLGLLEHDLRDPMRAIRLSAEALMQEDKQSTARTEAVVRIHDTSQRMQQMLQDLLDYTRTRLGAHLPLMVTHGDLSAVVVKAVEEQRGAYPGRHITLQCHDRLMGDWDAPRLAQMLTNVLGNAVEHGERDFPVTVSALEEDDQIVITVHNEGVPIPPDLLEAIFEPVMRSPSSRLKQSHFSGSVGVRLYVSNQIVKAHRGHIEVSSDDDRGTTFTIKLPGTPDPHVRDSACAAESSAPVPGAERAYR